MSNIKVTLNAVKIVTVLSNGSNVLAYTKTEVNNLLKAENIANTPSGNISSTTVQGAINELDTEKADRLFATNLVVNGDFSNGTTEWLAVYSSLSVTSNTLSITGDGTHSGARARQSSTLFTSGMKFYTKFKFRVTNSVCQNVFIRNFGVDYLVQPLPTINTFYEKSIITTVTSTGTYFGFEFIHAYVDSATANGKVMEVQNTIFINLTALFGAGNEPTKEQMDKLLSVYPNSWFNGTSEIGSIGALMRATLGVLVVTPTLLNSRTGTAQYVVSNDGLVIFRGTASGGSLNTNIFVLPENIRPAATRTFPISANGAFGVVTVAANGEVRQTVGALTNVFLDGIAFKVGV